MATQKEVKNGPINDKSKIKVSKNGPYLVSGGIPLVKQVIHIGVD